MVRWGVMIRWNRSVHRCQAEVKASREDQKTCVICKWCRKVQQGAARSQRDAAATDRLGTARSIKSPSARTHTLKSPPFLPDERAIGLDPSGFRVSLDDHDMSRFFCLNPYASWHLGSQLSPVLAGVTNAHSCMFDAQQILIHQISNCGPLSRANCRGSLSVRAVLNQTPNLIC